MKKRFTNSIKLYIINRVIDRTYSGDISQHNFEQKLSNEKIEVLGVDIPDEPLTNRDQYFSEAFSFRLRASVELAQHLKLIKNHQYPLCIGEREFLTSRLVTTRVGRVFRRMPSFLQITILSLTSLGQRIVGASNRFKWLSGLISFTILSVKVWQSGLIDKLWIGLSAILGLAIAALISSLR